jgi:uncharacterized protein YbaA (DUF1428 family)
MLMTYVDGFVVPVPKKALGEYKKVAKLAAKVWLEHGALSYTECIGDDVPVGKRTSFPRSVKLKQDEIVIFSFITYKSRKERDKVNKLAMNDPRMSRIDWKTLPFDGKRMIFGGFKTFLDK